VHQVGKQDYILLRYTVNNTLNPSGTTSVPQKFPLPHLVKTAEDFGGTHNGVTARYLALVQDTLKLNGTNKLLITSMTSLYLAKTRTGLL